MSDTNETRMFFGNSDFLGKLTYTEITGDDAEYFPKVLEQFSSFLRSAGFVYVGLRETEDGWLFHKDHDWRKEFFSEPLDDERDETEEAQDIINEAAESYWDKQVDETASSSVPTFEEGDVVYYHGRGEPEEKFGHNGNTGVSLVHMRGTVVKVRDSQMGLRYLIRFDNWNDGHNGLGDDPDARMSSQNYWWVSPTNISIVTPTNSKV